MDRLIKAGVKNVLELCVADVEPLRYKQELVSKILHTGSPLSKRKEPPALRSHLMSGGAWRWEQEDAHCSAESSFGGFVLSGIGEGKRTRTQMQEVKGLLFRIIKQTNKNYPVGEKQTGWLDKAGQGRTRQGRTGQGWTGHRRHLTNGNEPTRNCKHKEIIKGANDEGNEGKQLGKINQ